MTSAMTIESLERTSRNSAVFMALGAVVVAAALWLATSQLRSVQAEVATLNEQAATIRGSNEELLRTNADLAQSTDKLKSELAGAREALAASRNAIAAFHARDYATAVSLYDSALNADPGNAYLMNLKAYALFKSGRVPDAIEVQQQGVQVDPDYGWGYFDLARFQCAAGDKTAAAASLRSAVSKDRRMRALADQDGEFRRLCGANLQ